MTWRSYGHSDNHPPISGKSTGWRRWTRSTLLDTPHDEGLDRVVGLIKEIFTVEIGIVSLIDAHRQWYKSCAGMPVDEMPRQDTFCRYVVDSEEPIIVQDATRDIRFSQHPAVTGEGHIRFYAGVPLKTKTGHTIGTVCAIDRRPRSFGNRDLTILTELSGVAMDRISLMQSAATDSPDRGADAARLQAGGRPADFACPSPPARPVPVSCSMSIISNGSMTLTAMPPATRS